MNPNDNDLMQLATLAQILEQYGARAVQQTQQATGALQHTVQEASKAAQRITAEASEQLRRTASDTVTEGLRYALEDADRRLKNSVSSLESATQTFDAHMKAQRRTFAGYAWKSFIASALGSLAVIGAAAYMSIHTHQEIMRSEWIGQINAAIANGKLVACPDGGLCSYAGKKLVRLDQ